MGPGSLPRSLEAAGPWHGHRDGRRDRGTASGTVTADGPPSKSAADAGPH